MDVIVYDLKQNQCVTALVRQSLLRSANFSTFLIKNVPISGLNKTNEAPSVRKSGRELLLPALSYNELGRQTTRRSHDGLNLSHKEPFHGHAFSRPQIRLSDAGEAPRLHGGGRHDAGAGHRRNHGDFQRGERRAPEPVALSAAGPVDDPFGDLARLPEYVRLVSQFS